MVPSDTQTTRLRDKEQPEYSKISGAFEHVASVKAGHLNSGQAAAAALHRARSAVQLNAFISLAELSDIAVAADSAKDLPLAGLPIAVKDNIDVAGLPCSDGTPALKDWRPQADAAVITRLREAGAVVIGKANMHELAAGITSNNQFFGAVRNPHAPDLIAGGSSGGSAAAVASGVVAAALGTDTAGSCRIPASLCGCVGFRPSIGRYPMQGVIPLSTTRDTVGLFTRSVADTRLLDRVIAGGAIAPRSGNLTGRRIGVPRAYFFDNLDPTTAAVIENALALLKEAGAVLVETEVKNVAQLSGPISLPIIAYEALRDIAMYLNRHRSPITAWQIAEQVAGSLEKSLLANELFGEPVRDEVYRDILATARPALIHAYHTCFDESRIEALVLPTTAIPARPIGEDETVELSGARVPTLPIYLQNTDPSSVAGLPSISVPAGPTASGLPVGISFDALPGQDETLLALAEAFDALRPALPVPGVSFR